MAQGHDLLWLVLKVPHHYLGKTNNMTPCGMLFAAVHSMVPCMLQATTILDYYPQLKIALPRANIIGMLV